MFYKKETNNSNIHSMQSLDNLSKEILYFRSGTDLVPLLILFFLQQSSNKPTVLSFQIYQDEIWQECSSRKYAPTDRVGFYFRFEVIISKWRPRRPFTQQSVVLPSSERKQSICCANMPVICSTFVLNELFLIHIRFLVSNV